MNDPIKLYDITMYNQGTAVLHDYFSCAIQEHVTRGQIGCRCCASDIKRLLFGNRGLH